MPPAAADEDRAAHEPESAEDLYEHAPCGYLSCFLDGSIARVNSTFLEWTGFRRDDLVGRRRFVDLLSPGGRIYHETHYAPLLRMQGSVRAIALDVVRSDGSRMPVLVNSQLRTGPDGEPLAVRTTVFDATDRRTYETELLAARRRAERAATWMADVEDMVARLAAAPTVDDVAGVVADAGIALFGATRSVVWLAGSSAQVWAPVAGRGPDGPLPELPGAEDRPRLPPQGTDPDPEHPVTPLVGARGALGALALVVPAEETPGPDELRLLRTLGHQAGQAIERARLFDQERQVASTLQRSMLPGRLPDDPRIELTACYRPAVDGMQVGGDWYDAFMLDRDRMAVSVGDVVGRGLHAAAAMGQLRSAVRALAAVDAGPAMVLDRLDTFVEGVPAAQTATLAYAEVDLRDGTVLYACAGHPPPLVVEPDGRASQLWGGRSTPLGARFGTGRRSEASIVLEPGSRLALYTDGLVELRDTPLDESIDALAQVLARSAGRPMPGLADMVTDTVLGPGPTDDDVCLLAIGYRGPPVATPAAPAARSGSTR